MPQLNLADITGLELRNLLDASRRRGDATLSYQILQEMADRRESRGHRRPSKARRASGPHMADVELGEPLQADELPPVPKWRPPGGKFNIAAPTREDASQPAPARPLRLLDTDVPPLAAETWDPQVSGQDQRRPPHAPARPRRLLTFIIGMLAGVALGWWGADIANGGWPARPTPTPVAALPARRALVVTVPPVAEAAPAANSEAKGQDQPPDAEAPVTSAAEPDAVADDQTSPPPQPEAPVAPNSGVAADALSAASAGCAAEPTPADEVICRDPALRRLQRKLQAAYAEALDAHQDRALLREHQLAWRDARSTVTDPARLARTYEDRIRKLNAATSEARNGR